MPSPDEGFRSQVRGYRREQVDEVVRVLEARVAAHDRAIAQLRGEDPAPPPARASVEEEPTPGTSRVERAADARAGAERPVPWRRTDLLAPAAYLLIACWLLSGLIADLRTGYLSQGVQDQQAFEWYFGSAAHNLVTLLEAPSIRAELGRNQDAWRRVVAAATTAGVPIPGFSSALAYYDSLASERLPAALIQGLRDFFGAHTYQRIDQDGTFHTLWSGDRSEVSA